jgi:hypothetical protein
MSLDIALGGGGVNDPVSLEANANYGLTSINSGTATEPTPLVYTPNAGIDTNLAYLKQQLAVDTQTNMALPSTGLPPPTGYQDNYLKNNGVSSPGSIGDFLLWTEKWFKDMGTTLLWVGGGVLLLFIVIKANKN